MKKLARFLSLGLVLGTAALPSLFLASTSLQAEEVASSETVDAEFVKSIAPIIESALVAYNDGDWKAFFKDYSSSVAAVATEQAFDGVYKGMLFTKYGKYTADSKALLPAQSVAVPVVGEEVMPSLLLVFTGKFEKGTDKEGLARISVNLMKEGEGKYDYKIMQLMIDDYVKAE